jgi:hypothetical protein
MKVLILYNKQGDILSVGLPNETMASAIRLIPGEGQFVAEVDTTQVSYATKREAGHDDISVLAEQMVNNFRIQQEKLVAKG